MEDAVYHQANLVNDIVAHMYGLPFNYPHQEPAYTSIKNPSPTIIPTVQPTPVANVSTDLSNIIPKLLTRMKQMNQLLINMQTNKT